MSQHSCGRAGRGGVGFVCVVLFASLRFAIKSGMVSTGLWIALVTPAVVLCPFQFVWAI